MSYSYPRSDSANGYRLSRPDRFAESTNLHERLTQALPLWARRWVTELRERRIPAALSGARNDYNGAGLQKICWRIVRRVFSVANALILLWIFTLWWGERTVFRESLDKCDWNKWEKWVSDLDVSVSMEC
jgi:hypothetical protein